MTDTQTQPTRPKQESDQVEFVTDFDREQHVDRAVRTMCAFLNTGGGALYVGVGDGGKLVGLGDLDGAAERLRRALDERISPPYPAAVRVEWEENGRGYVVAEVPPGPEPPYAVGEDFYVRRGATQTVVGTVADMKKLLDLRKERAQRWERRPALGLVMSDLDLDEVHRTAAEAGRGRLSQLSALTVPRRCSARSTCTMGGSLQTPRPCCSRGTLPRTIPRRGCGLRGSSTTMRRSSWTTASSRATRSTSPRLFGVLPRPSAGDVAAGAGRVPAAWMSRRSRRSPYARDS